MQKLRISGVVYDMETAIPKTSLQTLLVMKRDYGYTMPMIVKLSSKLEKLTDPMAVLEDEELLQGFLVIIWLARRHNGEDVTLEESSNNVILDELELVDDGEPEQAPDPKEQTGSAADAAPTVAPASKSKTSKPRSTRTSRKSATTGQE